MLNQTSMPVHLVVDFAEDVYIHVGTDTKPSRSNVTDQASDHIIGGEVMRMSFYPDGLTLQNESLQNHLLLTAHLLDTYRKSTVSVEFCYPTQPALAWEFMKMVNQRRVPVKSFSFLIYAASSEFIPKILDECTEVTDLIWFNAMLPDNFFYTPPRPFKATEFRVNIATKWFDPQSFMSCRRIILKINRNSTWTAQWWNAFIQNWIDSDVALEYLSCNHTESSNFLEMISGLSQPYVIIQFLLS
uniref:FBA_2 domain-containing protein n=1 Tax=Caenorhabditis tropicalis TaxID=1561998 RepID=A0A1I7UPP6_9PELO